MASRSGRWNRSCIEIRKMSTDLPHKIVWAVDPFCEECTLVKQTARAVSVLATQWNAAVEPVYILGGVPPNVRLLPTLIQDVQAQAQTELRYLTRGIPIPQLADVRLIAGLNSQLRAQAADLIAYAKKSRADSIAVGTRARTGLKRWLIGSFAETLILESDVPLFIINPRESIPERIHQILFPTDFSERSKAAFKRVIRFAKEVQAELTVFHKIRYELTPAVEVAFGAYPSYKHLFQEEILAKETEANAWATQAENEGIQTDSVVDYRTDGSVAQAILGISKRRGGMIAMAAHSGPLASALLGSLTRQVVRSSSSPVWVIHTEQKAEPRGAEAAAAKAR